MTTKEKELETRLTNLEKAFIQSQKNGVIQTQTVDESKGNIAIHTEKINGNTEKITENTTEIEFASESIENIMTDALPAQNATLDEVADTLETIMTQILPSLMADNE